MKRTVFILLISVILFACDNSSPDNKITYPPPEYNPEQLEKFVDTIAANYPVIAHKIIIGKTPRNRDITALIISNNPGIPQENEPRVRLTGSIHGNEHVTTALLCELIDYLTANYTESAEVRDLVDNTYIAIIPMLNPDGVANHSRYTVNGVDLNRNFDCVYDSEQVWIDGYTHGDAPFSEAESRAVRDFSTLNDIFADNTLFHLSATYHSGETVVNLPFDFVSRKSSGIEPYEYSLVQYLAKEHYAARGTFLDNPDILFLPDNRVEEGTVNGGDWYIVEGSLQDWSYLETGCIDLTIEISDKKYGHSEEELAEIYDYNIVSMLAYIKAARSGVSGIVTDPEGGPVKGARIFIENSDLAAITDKNGYYHKLLHGLAGTEYTLTVKADTFAAQTRTITLNALNSVTNNEDFTLNPE